MKKIINILLIFIMSLCLVSCKSRDGLDKYRKNGQLIDLSSKELSNKLANQDTFIFFIQKKGCALCESIYPEVALFLDSNPDYVIHTIKREDIKGYDAYSYAALFSNCIGKQFYDETLEGRYGELFSPCFAKVVLGEFVDAHIGFMNAEQISYLYQLNYNSYDYYYNYTKTISKDKNSKHFFSLNKDSDYDSLLRNYFSENKQNIGYYYDISSFKEEDKNELLFKINKKTLQPKIESVVELDFDSLEKELLECLNLDSNKVINDSLNNNAQNFTIVLLNMVKNNEINQQSLDTLNESIINDIKSLVNEEKMTEVKEIIKNSFTKTINNVENEVKNLNLLSSLPEYFMLEYKNGELIEVYKEKFDTNALKDLYK